MATLRRCHKWSLNTGGVLNGGDKDSQMATVGDTKGGLIIQAGAELLNRGSFNTGLIVGSSPLIQCQDTKISKM